MSNFDTRNQNEVIEAVYNVLKIYFIFIVSFLSEAVVVR